MKTMRRAAAVAALCLIPWAAKAACEGPGLFETLSEAEAARLEATQAGTPYGTGLAWQAEKDGARIVVVGTMHLHDPRHAALMARIGPEITASDLVLVEMTPDDEREMMASMAADPAPFFITDGPTLPDLLPPDLWQEVSEAARARQLPAFLAAKQQPWFLSLTLSMPVCAMGDIVAGQRGLDHLIMDAATTAGVPLASLEAWSTLPDLFSGMPLDEQIDMLRLALLEPDMQGPAFVTMLDSYFSGRVAEIWAMQEILIDRLDPADRAAAVDGLKLSEDLLMVGRNRAWIPVILAASETHDRIVVAAGAAHMPGEEGVLRLLESDGWEVSPLN